MKILVIVAAGMCSIFGIGNQPCVKMARSEPMPAAVCQQMVDKAKDTDGFQTSYCEDVKP